MTLPAPPLVIESSPREDGFRMPGEFEPHAGTWMLWPERPDVWRDAAGPARRVFAEVAGAIARFEPLWMGVTPAGLESARALLPESVAIVELDYNDAWMRDIGPTFVQNAMGEVRGVDWRFNAWGGLYDDWAADDALPRGLLERLGIPRYRAPLVMEGGALAVDGEGTLIVTEQCLLSPSRNPGLNRMEIERHLREYLGVETIIWLGQGVVNDETSGHVDNLCAFVRPGVVVLAWSDDPEDLQYAISRDALRRLTTATDARGRRLEVHRLHVPATMRMGADEAAGIVAADGSHSRPAGVRLAASYVNYYVANGGIIVPLFDDPRDTEALETLARLYPEHEVVGVASRELLLGGGNIHCITQQQPAGDGGGRNR